MGEAQPRENCAVQCPTNPNAQALLVKLGLPGPEPAARQQHGRRVCLVKLGLHSATQGSELAESMKLNLLGPVQVTPPAQPQQQPQSMRKHDATTKLTGVTSHDVCNSTKELAIT